MQKNDDYMYKRPKHDNKFLVNDDLKIFYASASHHAKHKFGRELRQDELKAIARAQLQNPTTGLPRVMANFKDPDDKTTRKIAKLAQEDDINALLDKVEGILDRHNGEIQAKEDGIVKTRDRREKEREEKENRKRERERPPADMEFGFPDSELPRMNKRQVTRWEVLEIYAAARWYEPGGKRLEGTDFRSLLAELVKKEGNGPINAIPPFVKNFRDGVEMEISKGVSKVASLMEKDLLHRVDEAWRRRLAKPAVERPTTFPSSVPDLGPSTVNEGFSQGQQLVIPIGTPALAGSPVPPGYETYGSAYGQQYLRPVAGSRLPSQFPFSAVGHDAFLSPGAPNTPLPSQRVGSYEQQTTVNKANPAPSIRGLSISSSSGGSASPAQAEEKRQKEKEKARRETSKGDSGKKADKGAKKKPGNSRQDKADKDRVKKDRHPRQ